MKLSILKTFAINLAVLATLLLGTEFVLRFVDGVPGPYPIRTYPGESQNRDPGWERIDPDLGWVFSGFNTDTFFDRSLRGLHSDYTCNPQGFRDSRDFDRLPAKGPRKRILLLGDSFAFGVYLRESETLAASLRQLTDAEIYNLAIPGWGIDQMVLAYQKYRDRIRPDIVILAYIDPDIPRVFEAFRRAERLNKPSFRLEGGRLAPRAGAKPDWFARLARHSIIANKIHSLGYRYWESMRLTRAFFRELLDSTAAHKEKLIVVRLPVGGIAMRGKAPRLFSLDSFFRGAGALYIDAHPKVFELPATRRRGLFLPGNGHPSAEGNRFFAELLAPYVIEKGQGRGSM